MNKHFYTLCLGIRNLALIALFVSLPLTAIVLLVEYCLPLLVLIVFLFVAYIFGLAVESEKAESGK